MIGNQIWSIAQSDFRERTRRFSFTAICALSVFAAFLFVPDPDAEMVSIAVDADFFLQGTNWTWIPMASALCTGVLLPMTGFFYLRNSLTLDRKTGIVNLIYTSPVNRVVYLTGKYLSNSLILICILSVIVLSSFFTTLLNFPDMEIPVLHFLSFFISIIPGTFLCSAIALLCEAAPFFRGRSGAWLAGVIFFIFYIVCLNAFLSQPWGIIARFFDMTGFVWLKDSIDQSVYSMTGTPARVALGVYQDSTISNLNLPELIFLPLSFTAARLIEKGCMIGFGIIICIAAAAIVPRYENVRTVHAVSEKTHIKSGGHGLLVTEFILTFRNCSEVWYIIMSVLWLSMFAVDVETAQGTSWVLATAWSCILFSDYGCREKKSNLNILIPTFYHAYPHQLLMRWCVGGIISLLITAPVIIRAFFAGELMGAIAGIVFSLFVPALSIFLGGFSGSERTFEIVCLMICYLMLNSTSFIRLSVTSEKALLYCVMVSTVSFLMLIVSYCVRAFCSTKSWKLKHSY